MFFARVWAYADKGPWVILFPDSPHMPVPDFLLSNNVPHELRPRQLTHLARPTHAALSKHTCCWRLAMSNNFWVQALIHCQLPPNISIASSSPRPTVGPRLCRLTPNSHLSSFHYISQSTCHWRPASCAFTSINVPSDFPLAITTLPLCSSRKSTNTKFIALSCSGTSLSFHATIYTTKIRCKLRVKTTNQCVQFIEDITRMGMT